MRTALHTGWTVRAVRGDVPETVAGIGIPATVPGSVHTDLLAAGLIPDPYLDENERLVQWIGRTHWRYETEFDVPSFGDRLDLVCEGLDTLATVELNGTTVGRTANMHRTHRFDVRELVHPGRNTLAVTFASALHHVEARSKERGPRPHVNEHPFNEIRKMACNFGWDWGPDLVTAGIWQPVALHAWRTARIGAVRPLVAVADGRATVSVHVDVERDSEQPLRVVARVGEHSTTVELPAGATSGSADVVVDNPRLWWPHSHGEQPLYPVRVELHTADGEALDSWQREIGLRTVRLDTGADEYGTRFTLLVNDRPVFVRGANWIPDDAFPTRVDPARYRHRIEQGKETGINLLRVWGGGIYESETFYDTCDRSGILVWQDFLFACAAYAEEQPLRGEVEAEAREAVTRLSSHPSLVLWNGCNENIWGYVDWGWREQLGDRTWGLGYYLDLLPGIVAELDPTRPYSAGSPWSLTMDRHPNDPEHGTMHIWDVWNTVDYAHYRDYVPRFVAEFGFQGPPTWATLTRAVHDDPLAPDSPAMLLHQKAENGNGKLDRWIGEHFAAPGSFADWHWATSLNQARAVALGVEHFRSFSPRCMGTVVWQLNDCWPVNSWAAVDGDGRRKPLWYALRRSYTDRLLTIQPRGSGLAVVAVNDTDAGWAATVTVTRRGFDGTVLQRCELSLEVAGRDTVTLELPVEFASPQDAAAELLVAETDRARAYWFFREDKDLALPAPRFDAEASAVDGGYLVRVTARALLRDLSVLADRVCADAVVDDMLLTLLPGESAAVLVRTTQTCEPAAFLDPAVLRSANQLRA